jgi:hypothetical protein
MPAHCRIKEAGGREHCRAEARNRGRQPARLLFFDITRQCRYSICSSFEYSLHTQSRRRSMSHAFRGSSSGMGFTGNQTGPAPQGTNPIFAVRSGNGGELAGVNPAGVGNLRGWSKNLSGANPSSGTHRPGLSSPACGFWALQCRMVGALRRDDSRRSLSFRATRDFQHASSASSTVQPAANVAIYSEPARTPERAPVRSAARLL